MRNIFRVPIRWKRITLISTTLVVLLILELIPCPGVTVACPGETFVPVSAQALSLTPDNPVTSHESDLIVNAAVNKVIYGGEPLSVPITPDLTEDDIANTQPIDNDTTPPGWTDIYMFVGTPGSITIYWKSPGDDGYTGCAYQYDIRYSTSPIDGRDWNSPDIFQVDDEPVPLPAGSIQKYTLSGLQPETTLYFKLRTSDESLNWSYMSLSIEGSSVLSGDANQDGVINMGDVTLVERMILGYNDAPGFREAMMNRDGTIDMGTVVIIERMILGLGIQ